MHPTPDVYADHFSAELLPYDAHMIFALSPAIPASPAAAQAIIRMPRSLMKVMVYVLHKMVRDEEYAHGLIAVPIGYMAQTGIAPEDWEQFWCT